jgi:peptidoglycan hydrolase CwlO-like protein
MTRVTATLDEGDAEYLEAVKEAEGLDSDVAAVRECIDRTQEHADAQQRVEARIEELRNELAAANRRIDSADELVEYVSEERSVEQRRRQAGIVTRAKWFLTGMPDEEE